MNKTTAVKIPSNLYDLAIVAVVILCIMYLASTSAVQYLPMPPQKDVFITENRSEVRTFYKNCEGHAITRELNGTYILECSK